MKVALFVTCMVDTIVPQMARATAVLLERLGHEVVVLPGPSCCGQMHVNTGYRREAVPIVANHVRAFDGVLSPGVEATVAPSGSCVASIHHQQAAVARRAGERTHTEPRASEPCVSRARTSMPTVRPCPRR